VQEDINIYIYIRDEAPRAWVCEGTRSLCRIGRKKASRFDAQARRTNGTKRTDGEKAKTGNADKQQGGIGEADSNVRGCSKGSVRGHGFN
jgi:hypothetical protein